MDALVYTNDANWTMREYRQLAQRYLKSALLIYVLRVNLHIVASYSVYMDDVLRY